MDRMDLTPAVHHVSGGIYVVQDFNYWQTNTIFYIAEHGVVFVDATYSEKSARVILWKAMTLTQENFTGLILTSHELHRSGGSHYFLDNNIPLVIQKTGYLAMHRDWASMNESMKKIFPSYLPQPYAKPTGIIEDNAIFLDGKIQVFYPGPAHNDDNLILYFPDEKIVYAGSLLSDPLMFFDGMKKEGYLNALDQIDALHPEKIITGHGDPVQPASFTTKMRNLVNKMDVNRLK